MSIDAKMVAQLREMTGAGMMDAKKALQETNGDLEKAVEELRKRGAAKAAKKSDRETGEGLVHAYIHGTGKIGAMVQVLCETDFVARNDQFKEFCHNIAMHVAAAAPDYVSREDVPQENVQKEKETIMAELKEQGKPEEMIEKITEGKLDKWYGEICLLEQKYILDEEKTITQVTEDAVLTIGENIRIGSFTRYQIG